MKIDYKQIAIDCIICAITGSVFVTMFILIAF
jgi:hypothetical protein